MENILNPKATKLNKLLEPFSTLIGEWKTVGKHPLFPDVTLTGNAIFKWLENGAFIQMNSSINHEQFPDGVAILGSDDSSQEITMIYYDERGVSRRYSCTLKNNIWSWWRDNAEFSQQFHGEILDEGNTIISTGKMSRNDGPWENDLELTYKRINF